MSSDETMKKRSLDSPEETINMEKGKIDIVNIGNLKITRFTLEPGWTWEKCEKPMFNTDSCQLTHQGYLLSGRIVVKMMASGKEVEYEQGDVFFVPPGHDAWVVGDKPVVGLDISPTH